MRAPHQPQPVIANRLLAALPRAEYERLAPHLRKVKLTKNSILYDTGEDVHDAYFVQSGINRVRESSKRSQEQSLRRLSARPVG